MEYLLIYIIGFTVCYFFLKIYYYATNQEKNRFRAYIVFCDNTSGWCLKYIKEIKEYEINHKVQTASVIYSTFWFIFLLPMFIMYLIDTLNKEK